MSTVVDSADQMPLCRTLALTKTLVSFAHMGLSGLDTPYKVLIWNI